jgi:hypothetical protein
MKKTHMKAALAMTVLGASIIGVQAQAVEIAFTGGSNTSNLDTVVGNDGIGDVWQTHNGVALLHSNFAMADFNATPQQFNSANFSNGLGSFANSFQLTLNNSQFGRGFRGIDLGSVASGLTNHFTVMADVLDPSTWISWNATYNLLDATSGLFQQVLFTSPAGTSLTQGTNFSVNVNFDGIMTNDSGWAASFDDRAGTVPEPATLSLFGLGIAAVAAKKRRKTA